MIIPDGYEIKGKFGSRGYRRGAFIFIGALITFVLFRVFVNMTDLVEFLRKVNSPSMLTILGIGLLLFAYMHTFVHEKIHQLCYRRFGSKTNLQMRSLMPNVTLSIGDGCIRNKAIIVALSPLVVLEIAGLVACPFVTGGFLLLIIFFLSENVGLAIQDLALSVWLRKYPRSYYFGFD